MLKFSTLRALQISFVCSAAALMPVLPVSAGPPETEAAKKAVQTTSISLEKGNYFQIFAPLAKPDAKKVRDEYYSFIFPKAGPLGLARRGQMLVTQSLVSDYNPEGFVFVSWPKKQNFDQFIAKPEWPAVEALRPEGWSELKIYSSTIEAPVTLNFRSDKSYTVAVAWANPADPRGYDRYMAGIADTVADAGGRFMYKMRTPTFTTLTSSPEAPLQLTIVEWDNADGLQTLLKSEAYQDNQANFQSGVSRFEFYRVEPTFPK